MDLSLLDLLRCPFCGTRLDLVDNEALVRDGATALWGVLGCQCCAFPIIDGIPVLIADDATRTAMHTMEASTVHRRLMTLLPYRAICFFLQCLVVCGVWLLDACDGG